MGAALAAGQRRPQPLALQRVLAEQRRADVLVEHGRAQVVGLDEDAARRPVGVGDGEQRLLDLARGGGVAVPVRVHGGTGDGGEDCDLDAFDRRGHPAHPFLDL